MPMITLPKVEIRERSMDDFLGMGQIIKEQRAEIERLRMENQLLFDSIKGNDADLDRFNGALQKALAAQQTPGA